MKVKMILKLFLFILFSCGSVEQKKNDQNNYQAIKLHDIDFVEIKKNEDNTENLTYKLHPNQVNDFVNKWNNARSVGGCKYWSEYRITVYFKCGQPRHFRAINGIIKETNDMCFEIGSEKYFENIWKKFDK